MRYSHSFYLDLLGFLRNKFPTFYWGEDEKGYYWGEGEVFMTHRFNSLQDLIENISNYLHLE